MIRLPEQFKERMQKRLGGAYPAFLSSYAAPPQKGLRVNPLKISAEEFFRLRPFPLGERVPWEQDGFYVAEQKYGAHPYHFAGLYYLQEPSAMCAAPLLNANPGEKILDLCAAPGGKTAQIAARTGGKGVIIANEISFPRAKILSENVERMGIADCAVTSASPESLKTLFPAYFDKILVDAPCSGEGMFKKEPEAAAQWSPALVEQCAARQRAILDCAADMLAEGGALVYSTCTFAEEEDEWQIGAFLERHPDFTLCTMEKRMPHTCKGEGQFVASLIRTAPTERRRARPYPARRNAAAERAFSRFAEEFFRTPPQGEIATLPDGRMYLIPAGIPDLTGVQVLRLGVELGAFDGKLFKPAHALASAFGAAAENKVSLSVEEAKRYLRGETVGQDSLADGWCVVCADGYPLGLGKAVRGTVKNHYPKGLRLRT